jgi:hypothetical protein
LTTGDLDRKSFIFHKCDGSCAQLKKRNIWLGIGGWRGAEWMQNNAALPSGWHPLLRVGIYGRVEFRKDQTIGRDFFVCVHLGVVLILN